MTTRTHMNTTTSDLIAAFEAANAKARAELRAELETRRAGKRYLRAFDRGDKEALAVAKPGHLREYNALKRERAAAKKAAAPKKPAPKAAPKKPAPKRAPKAAPAQEAPMFQNIINALVKAKASPETIAQVVASMQAAK